MTRTHYYQKPAAKVTRRRTPVRPRTQDEIEEDVDRSGIDIAGGTSTKSNGELHGASAKGNGPSQQ